MGSKLEEVQDRVHAVANTTHLSSREAEVYVLREEEGFTHAEVAEELEISEGNARGKWGTVKEKVSLAEEEVEIAENTADLL